MSAPYGFVKAKLNIAFALAIGGSARFVLMRFFLACVHQKSMPQVSIPVLLTMHIMSAFARNSVPKSKTVQPPAPI